MKLTVIDSGSKGNCYVMKSSTGEVLLIEAGVKFSKIKETLGFNINNVNGIIVTHEHLDHSKGIKDALNAGLPVYASSGTIDAMKLSHHRLHSVEKQKPFRKIANLKKEGTKGSGFQ